MAMFVLPNLNFTTTTDGGIFGEQVEKIFVVNFDKRALETKTPSASSFLTELPGTGEDRRDSSGDDSHAVLGICRVGVEVDAGHCMRFAGTGLSVCENGTVETLQEP